MDLLIIDLTEYNETKRQVTNILTRVAKTSSIENLGKIKVSASTEVYSKNATFGKPPTVGNNINEPYGRK